MLNRKFYERGSLMVEVIAVIALLGAMGSLMFRQMQQRNDELDSINMASEIRMVKEATTAYIQAYRADLERTCVANLNDGYADWQASTAVMDDIEQFMPDHWASSFGNNEQSNRDGILYDYNIYLSCNIVDENVAPRYNIYGTIIPDTDAFPDLTLKKASRVANLIGSDGGVHLDGEDGLHGTMGAWEMNDCPLGNCPGGNYFVATTGMDIFVPEAELQATNAAVVPQSLALNALHSANFFSVGRGDYNCVADYADGKFHHETVINNGGDQAAADDTIRHAGEGPNESRCDPLFWVGTTGTAGSDNSTAGHVYVRNNLYVGRDNTNNRQAIALETDASDNANRKIAVFSADGNERLTLNAHGQVIGRVGPNGQGYRLDPLTNSLVFFKKETIDIGSVEVPTMRLRAGVLETDVQAVYYDGNTLKTKDVYKVDPARTSIMEDIVLTSRGGAKLSEILPDYILKGVDSKTLSGSASLWAMKPDCPEGYVKAIVATPTTWSQYVTNASLTLNGTTNNTSTTGNHNHPINLTISNTTRPAITTAGQYSSVTVNSAKGSIKLEQLPPPRIEIFEDTSSDQWEVYVYYGDGIYPTSTTPITVLIQLYCVYDSRNFSGSPYHTGTYGNVTEDYGDMKMIVDNFYQEAGTSHEQTSFYRDDFPACTKDAECLNTEKCVGGMCATYGDCTESDGQSTSGGSHLYCFNGKKTYFECTDTTPCSNTNQTCINYRCVTQ